jgi:hypothetical protein
MAEFYIHVRKYSRDMGETWHRVFPRSINDRKCTRIKAVNGEPVWLHDLL